MRAGDIVTWTNTTGQSVKTQIKVIYYHKTFATYLKARTLRACLPGVATIADGVKIYHGFYSREDEKKYGIAAIELTII
jgi:ASC-1-like (ASCH) protein